MERKYGLGLDIGIGSVGAAVISWTNRNDARIEMVAVRLFDSGELPKPEHGNYRSTQVRRGFRSSRRLTNRRRHRKERTKRFLDKIGLISYASLKEAQERNGNQNVLQVRLKGLTEKLSPEELADCVIHICNNRGYREFYEDDEDDKKDSEAKKIKPALDKFEQIFQDGAYKSVADMLLHDEVFKTATAFPDYRNHKDKERYILIKREYLRKELMDILRCQQRYYPRQLTDHNIAFLCDRIVFAQRDFEDGPGDRNDKSRKFMGFLDSLGQCMFYKDERRAFRSTVIADIYAMANCLSQYSFVNKETGEIILDNEAASEVVDFALLNGGITESDVKKILKKHKLELRKPESLDDKLPDTVKTLKTLKGLLEACGYDYAELASEDQFDLDKPSRLHRLCVALSENITPARRKKAVARLGWNERLQEAVIRKKFGKTASVCERYMLEAIAAFKNGETYGNFQARRLEEKSADENPDANRSEFLKPITKNILNGGDEDVVKNAVVFKAINETRKVVNAIIRKYGSLEYINVEVADNLGRSEEERKKVTKENNKNRKKNEDLKNKLVELGLRKEGEVRPVDITRYKLWQAQQHRDLYSGLLIAENDVLSPMYDIDHIVPFSLILDDTLNNKALVNMGANRALKAQQVPLGYLQGKQKEDFQKRVNEMFLNKLISKKKYQYLMLPSVYTEEAQAILAEWKSRNINDTRYITRYIANYLESHLLFSGEKKKHVFAVNGAITSQMRIKWLNERTWGSKVKNRENNLHHAADAVVIANLTPAYIEIARDNMKLGWIHKNIKKRESAKAEYAEYLGKAVKKMREIYGFDEGYTESLLRNHNRIPSFVRNLYDEVDTRLMDPTAPGYEEYCLDNFQAKVRRCYRSDEAFAASVKPVLVSCKQNRKFQGEITDSQPVKRSELKATSILKKDSLGNDNVLSANKYYCVEVYKDTSKATRIRGIRFIDMKKKNKKLYLVTPNPEDYSEHVMYLFTNDYVRIYGKNGTLKFEGYYKSVKSINLDRLSFVHDNVVYDEKHKKIIQIGRSDSIKKYNVDILGELGGEIKCSEPFMFLPEAE